ncbi:MAG: HAD-IIIA family hydrolase [Planctomycetes bacterium]|nr:HAD-IIIA family hydrolase [Planctomycetota bacterium]
MDAAVFLDRDNTLIANDGDLGEPEDVRLLGGVPAGLKALHDAGFRLIVVTNQGGVARGRFTEDDVDAVHQRIAMLVDEGAGSRSLINRFYYCPYHPEAPLEEYRRDHPWRKPNPGMLLQAARDLHLDLKRCWMIGDQPRDVAAGHAAGCRTVLISEHGEAGAEPSPTGTAASFRKAVELILHSGTAPNGAAPTATKRPPRPAPDGPSAPPRTKRKGGTEVEGLRKAILDLTEEMRGEHLKRAEFTIFRLAAGMTQLLALLLAVLGLMQLGAGSTDVFMRWMAGAVLAQLMTIALLLADLKG